MKLWTEVQTVKKLMIYVHFAIETLLYIHIWIKSLNTEYRCPCQRKEDNSRRRTKRIENFCQKWKNHCYIVYDVVVTTINSQVKQKPILFIDITLPFMSAIFLFAFFSGDRTRQTTINFKSSTNKNRFPSDLILRFSVCLRWLTLEWECPFSFLWSRKRFWQERKKFEQWRVQCNVS